MIFNLVELKEAFVAKFGDDGLKIWDCLEHKRSHANYILGYTNSPNQLIEDYYFEEDSFDDTSNEELEYLSSQLEEEDLDCEPMCDDMYPMEEIHSMEEMTHFMISTIDLRYGDYDTAFGYAKLTEKGTVEFMNITNYGDRKIPYSASYHSSIMKDEQKCLPSEVLGLYYDKTETGNFEKFGSGKTYKGYRYYQTFYSIIKK